MTRYLLSVLGLLLAAATANAQNGQASNQSLQSDVPVAAVQMQAVLDGIVRSLADTVQASSLPDGRIQLAGEGHTAVLEFRVPENLLRIVGSPKLVTMIARLSIALAGQPAGHNARLIPLGDQGQTALSKQVVFQAGSGAAAGGPAPSTVPVQPPVFRGFRRVQLASAQQESPAVSGQDEAGEENPLRGLPLQQFDGVQVEMLPEIDAIILRGRDKQLEDLAEIIKQLDEASRQAQPEIEVLLLQHVDSQALASVILTAQQSVLASRQGRVTATALNNPNALLMIGWGEALQVAKELISKLDRPVPPSSTFDVIQLKHAQASQVQTQLQSIFQTRGGLSPVIQTAIDARINALIVHAAPRDLEEIKLLVARLDVARGDVVLQTKVYEIRHSLAADIAATLRQAIASNLADANLPIQLVDKDGQPLATSASLTNSRITVSDRNNTIIISSSAENLQVFERLIEQLDTPGVVAKIKIFPIINADAGALVETLRSLIPAAGPGVAGAPQLSSAPDETSLVPLRFTVDGRGNNIIAVGSEGDLQIVEALIVRLDESDTMQRKSTVYQLKNSPAVDIALAVNEFLRSKRQVEIVSPGSVNPFEQLEREVVVVPEPVQNKLILSATPRYYEEISRLIEQLDQQPPQVMIQVLIAEIALGNTHEFGMELGLQSSVLFDRSLLGDLLTRTTTTTTSTPAGVVTETVEEIVAATNTPGFNFNNSPLGNSGSAQSLANSNQVGGQGLSNFSVGRTNEQLGFGGLVLSASSENVSFLLRALQECRRLEILSRPQVLTLDNQQAFIQVGQRVPRITSANVTQFGYQTGVDLENIGLIIGVTPRISPEGNVVMEIDAEKSKIRPESEGIPISVAQDGSVIRSPIIDTITAQATVSAADGETIILGGLISREQQTDHRKVPWLGDIPVLRNFFRYEFNRMVRAELLIIMTPHIIRSEGDMQRMKQAEFSRMSWCEADVFDIHGDLNASVGPNALSLEDENWQVVYPDLDPRGKPSPPVREAVPPTAPLPDALPGLPGPSGSLPMRNPPSTAQLFPAASGPTVQASYADPGSEIRLREPAAGDGAAIPRFQGSLPSAAAQSVGDTLRVAGGQR